MSQALVLSIDAMGGDDAPEIVIDGAGAVSQRPQARGEIPVARRRSPARALARRQACRLSELCEIRHSDSEVDMSAKPSEAVRRSRGSSMWNAVLAVKNGEPMWRCQRAIPAR
jgi:glycerol-3-phosphate acyltransferase PlsX